MHNVLLLGYYSKYTQKKKKYWLFWPNFGSNMDKLKHWVNNLI